MVGKTDFCRMIARRSRLLLALALLVGVLFWLFQSPAAGQSRSVRLAHRAARWPLHWAQGRLAMADRHLSLTLDSVAWQTLTEVGSLALRRGLRAYVA